MNNYCSIIIFAFACAWGFPKQAPAQDPATAETKTSIQLQGIVTSRKKYSFTVKQGDTEYTVKPANGAPIGLKMNKPWFDWGNNQVVVDAVPIRLTAANGDSLKRVALRLPAEKLFLISRLGDAAKMKRTMSAEVKRINFYLITPEDPGPHFPTDEQPYISGELSIKDNSPALKIKDDVLPLKLGFRYATMNGFSIAQLEPDKTQVFLSGTWHDGDDKIIATRILFQPIAAAQTVTARPRGRVQPVAKQ